MTPRQNLQMQYWQLAQKEVVSLSDSVVGDVLFGKKPCDLRRVSLLHNLWFYLDTLQQQREMDYTRAVFDIDYVAEFCLKKIQKQLECCGISSTLIANLIGVYTASIATNVGIGGMVIQGAVNPFRVRGNTQQSTGYVSATVPANIIQAYTTYIININQNQCCSVKPLRPNISSDQLFVSLLPGNYRFNSVVFVNHFDLWAQLSMGVTPGGVECFGNQGMDPTSSATKGITTITVNKTFSLTTPTTLYLHHAGLGDTWNGTTFDIEFIFDKL